MRVGVKKKYLLTAGNNIMKETIIQFGSGNFLRGFVDHFVHILNEKGLYDGKVVIVQPTASGKTEVINNQNGIYNLFLQGIKENKEVFEHTEIHSVSRGVDPYTDFSSYLKLAENPDMRFIISNTTEAGIEFDESCAFDDKPALSFPGKLTQLLYHRYKTGLSGFAVIPCELIDNNGDELKNCVIKYANLWDLGVDFISWVENENVFSNTLVDRIVTGYPKESADKFTEIVGYDDKLLDTAEPFHLWVIEGNFENELPLQSAGINVVWTNDVLPYKKMKVRILNGSHTALVFPSLLYGVDTVKESLDNELLNEYLNKCLFGYILSVLGENGENLSFAKSVIERFSNPYLKHQWKSISLNSVSKFSVRVFPTIIDYMNFNGALPKPLIFSLACLIEYYKSNEPSDNEQSVTFIKENTISEILSNKALWGYDLSMLTEIVNEGVERIHSDGITEAIKWAMS